MPTYDEWQALLYITWYHPSHVNLAYSMISAMLVEKEYIDLANPTLTETGCLYVSDFGSGTLAMRVDCLHPEVGFVTCHNNHISIALARSVSPFSNDQIFSYMTPKMKPLCYGELSEVTEWRRSLKPRIEPYKLQYGNYLDTRVTWQYPDVECLVYTRNEDDLPW